MSTSISLRWLSGRFHHTPWGRHVNEGAVEWPPSPWRLLRGLVAAWFALGEPEKDVMVSLLRKLRACPLVSAPQTVLGRTCHHFPWTKDGPESRTSPVFDTFLAVDRNAHLDLWWPHVTLAQDEGRLLRLLLGRLTYFGRSESWCEAGVVERTPAPPNCRPLESSEEPRAGEDVISLLAADDTGDPVVLLAALCTGTAEMRRRRMLQPVSTRWVRYARPRDLVLADPLPPPRSRPRPRVGVVRYALGGRVLPTVFDAIDVGDAARRAAMARFGRQHDGSLSLMLSGRSAEGTPLLGHRHAHYIPTDEDGDGRLDHLAVWCPEGLELDDLVALRSLTMLRRPDRPEELRLLLLEEGPLEAVRWSAAGPARVWRSATPFVPVRYPKERGGREIDTPEDQVALELRRRNHPVPVRVARIWPKRGTWLEYRRWRRGGGTAAGGWAFGFLVEFSDPVRGPIALGYGSHYGLGLFVPDR